VRKRQTIGSPVEISGRGVHSGELGTLRLVPAASGAGISFRRTDLRVDIPARLENLAADQLLRRTTLAAGDAKVHTIEHVLSAAAGLGVDDLLVEMNCAEPPFADGSAAPFVELIRRAGIVSNDASVEPVQLPSIITYHDADAEIVALPSSELRVTYFFTSARPQLRAQAASVLITPESYATQVAPARTFCFFEEIEALRRANLIKGASLASAVVIGRKAILNESLRFPDEPVRHKILDFIGDLALLQRPLTGHFLAWRAGHRVNAAFALHLRKELGF
jgi:UDP-3-O-acyl N-acetylglucosamine deacetylase